MELFAKVVNTLNVSVVYQLSGFYMRATLEFNELATNSFMTKAVIIYKPVHWFALQINGLVSI